MTVRADLDDPVMRWSPWTSAIALTALTSAIGVLVAWLGRGGAEHHCAAGAPASACFYPEHALHWVLGLLIGLAVGLVLFLFVAGSRRWIRRNRLRRTDAPA